MAEQDFLVRVPVSLKPSLERRAQENSRSVAGEVRHILRTAVEPSANVAEPHMQHAIKAT